MPKKKQTTKEAPLSLVEWCDKQVADGKELKLNWDGGGDSGWVYLEIDGTHVEDDYAASLVEALDNQLEYGSWAGEFGANGSALYDPATKSFVGEDHYSETRSVGYNPNITIKIPKHLWFNELKIHIESDDGSGTSITLELALTNGFKIDEHYELEKKLVEYIEEKIEEAITNFRNSNDDYDNFNGIWDEITIPYTEGKLEGDHLVFSITDLEMRYYDTTDKEIYLDVTEVKLLEHEKRN